jgi:hypothetical protein
MDKIPTTLELLGEILDDLKLDTYYDFLVDDEDGKVVLDSILEKIDNTIKLQVEAAIKEALQMTKKEKISLLYTIYSAGFDHGSNEGPFPEHGTFEAFERLLKSESPLLDNSYYDIKDKVDKLLG